MIQKVLEVHRERQIIAPAGITTAAAKATAATAASTSKAAVTAASTTATWTTTAGSPATGTCTSSHAAAHHRCALAVVTLTLSTAVLLVIRVCRSAFAAERPCLANAHVDAN